MQLACCNFSSLGSQGTNGYVSATPFSPIAGLSVNNNSDHNMFVYFIIRLWNLTPDLCSQV